MRPLRPVFLSSFLFSFHLALLMYLNSTVLSAEGSALQATIAYTLGSMLSLILLVMSPRLIRKLGVSIFLICSICATAIILWVLGMTITHNAFFVLFIIYFSLNLIVWYGFDLLFEHYSRKNFIGNIRGLILTFDNIGVMAAPVIASIIIGFAGFSGTYFIAAIIVVFSFLALIQSPLLATHAVASKNSLSESFKALVEHRIARRIVTLYFVLQFFYAWMVLYMAPYMLSLGFTWANIGIIFSIMLAPFVILQYRVGKIADKFHAERKIIFIGFLIAAGATAVFIFPLTQSAVLFTVILFITRIGASLIEVGCESAFFKEVQESDIALIGTLRMTMPIAYIIAPLCGALILTIGSPRLLFGILAIILSLAMLYTRRIRFTA